jgi:hypothetical protein
VSFGHGATGWDHLDVVFVTGDAYVDHPSFGAALLGRLLEAKGWKVGIVAQPRWIEQTISGHGRTGHLLHGQRRQT